MSWSDPDHDILGDIAAAAANAPADYQAVLAAGYDEANVADWPVRTFDTSSWGPWLTDAGREMLQRTVTMTEAEWLGYQSGIMPDSLFAGSDLRKSSKQVDPGVETPEYLAGGPSSGFAGDFKSPI